MASGSVECRTWAQTLEDTMYRAVVSVSYPNTGYSHKEFHDKAEALSEVMRQLEIAYNCGLRVFVRLYEGDKATNFYAVPNK